MNISLNRDDVETKIENLQEDLRTAMDNADEISQIEDSIEEWQNFLNRDDIQQLDRRQDFELWNEEDIYDFGQAICNENKVDIDEYPLCLVVNEYEVYEQIVEQAVLYSEDYSEAKIEEVDIDQELYYLRFSK